MGSVRAVDPVAGVMHVVRTWRGGGGLRLARLDLRTAECAVYPTLSGDKGLGGDVFTQLAWAGAQTAPPA